MSDIGASAVPSHSASFTGFNLGSGGTQLPGPNLWGGTGVPAAGLGANGDYYLRTDGGASTHLYFKSAGTWAGLV